MKFVKKLILLVIVLHFVLTAEAEVTACGPASCESK
jgi:hypothetical protein